MKRDRRWKGRAFLAMSLDGYIAREDGDVSWLEELSDDVGHVPTSAENPALVWETFFPEVDTIVMGRGTFEKLLTFGVWPFDEVDVLVLSTTLQTEDARVKIARSLGELTERLSGDQVKNVYIDGGATIRSFLREGLLDELTVAVVPVILGTGISLFGKDVPETSLRVRGSHVTGEGLVRITYEIAPA